MMTTSYFIDPPAMLCLLSWDISWNVQAMVPEAYDHPRVALHAVNYHSICGLLWYDTASHGQTRHLRSSLSDMALPRKERCAGVRPWCADQIPPDLVVGRVRRIPIP